MIKDIDEFIKKVNQSKKDNKLDLSADEDLSIAIMNLISIEEHFFFTAGKTGDPKYFDMLAEVREMRKDLFKKIVKDPKGEVWCISKHLLASSIRLMEVGTKAHSRGMKKEAKDFFNKSYKLYTLFWGLNLGAIDIGKVTAIGGQKIDKNDKGKGIFQKLGALVKRAIDCCIE